MVALDHTIEPFFVGAFRGVEAKVLPTRPWRHALFPFEPIHRRQWWKNAGLPFSMFRSLNGIRRVLRETDPVLAIGTGGYASGVALWAASGRGIPIVLQEQNAYPGFVTRRLAGRAAQIHLGFPEAINHLKPGKQAEVLDTGNPIVPPPRPLPDQVDAKLKWGFSPEQKVVLVAGGSQGSLAMNEVVSATLSAGLWPKGVGLVWQAGAATRDRFAHHAKPGLVAVEGFIDPMADAYGAADLAVVRGGAITAADVAAWGLPSIIVPLPTSAENHQLVNARALDAAGAAILLEQKNLTPDSLVRTMTGVLFDPAKTADLVAAASERARPSASSDIAAHALRLIRKT
jgi:UDP-N-acetylglucosamine--N-acetylmuramyl-(pentapeptide) pyrophosphoryl-undecaprenol N-acetylglucosamine transferase